MIATDALNYILRNIEHATDDALLTVTLTRLAVICAGLPSTDGFDLRTGGVGLAGFVRA